jgi:hypothetical protein
VFTGHCLKNQHFFFEKNNFFKSKLKVFYFNVFEIAANKLGSPVNLMDLKLDANTTQSVRWAPDTIELEDESMPKVKKKKQPDEDSAALRTRN